MFFMDRTMEMQIEKRSFGFGSDKKHEENPEAEAPFSQKYQEYLSPCKRSE